MIGVYMLLILSVLSLIGLVRSIMYERDIQEFERMMARNVESKREELEQSFDIMKHDLVQLRLKKI